VVNIYQYTHGLMIREFETSKEVSVVYDIAKRFYSTKREILNGKTVYKTDTIYSLSNLGYTKEIEEIFFCIPICRLDELRSALDQYLITYRIIEIPFTMPDYQSSMELIGKKLYDYQEYYVNYVLEEGTHKLLPIQTGKGKGTIMIASLARLGCRVMVETKKGFLGKLKREMVEVTNLNDKDILIIESKDKLLSLIKKSKEGEVMPPVLMCGIHTIYGFVKEWQSGVYGYGMDSEYNPINLYQVLGVGARARDEVHMVFDMIFKTDLVTNIPKTIYMSATFDADASMNRIRARMQRQLIPLEARPANLKPDAYTTFVKSPFQLKGSEKAIYKAEHSPYGYSHNKYEGILLKDNRLRDRFFNYLSGLFKTYYIDIKPTSGKKEKKRCLFLFSRKDTCQLFMKYLKRQYPKLDIRKYTGDDPEDNLIESTVLVATWQSAGTAQNMPGLITLINTVLLRSKEATIQIPGRLRDPKKIGLTMEPHYVVVYNTGSTWQHSTSLITEKMIRDYMKRIIELGSVDI
jgi:hypothetical protein